MAEQLTLQELFALFNRPQTETRFVPAADSQEYLALVNYLVQRNTQ